MVTRTEFPRLEPEADNLDQERLLSQQASELAKWHWRMAACASGEIEALELQRKQEKLAWEEKTGCQLLVSIDREKLMEFKLARGWKPEPNPYVMGADDPLLQALLSQTGEAEK